MVLAHALLDKFSGRALVDSEVVVSPSFLACVGFSAAVTVLLRRRGLEALDDATPALFDPDSPVRGAAALQIAALGSGAVPALESLIPGRTAEDLIGVLTALRWSGTDGVATVTKLAKEHPDERVRDLALLTLGRSRSH